MSAPRILEQYKPKRFEDLNKQLEIIKHGSDNMRSVVTEELIKNSPTSKQCVGTRSNFIAGSGFNSDISFNLSGKPHKKRTVNNLRVQFGRSIAIHESFFAHVRYNALYQKVGVDFMPYTQCRLGLPDSDDYSGKIVRSKIGFSKRNTYKGKNSTLEVFNQYNPDPEVIQAQVDAAGGWRNYKGQIFHFKMNDDHFYPLSKIEGVENFAHTEVKMGSYFASTVERRFENIQLFEHALSEDDGENRAVVESIKGAAGVDDAGNIVYLPYKSSSIPDKENLKYRLTPVENNSSPEQYEAFFDRSSSMIRRAFNIPTQIIEAVSGKLSDTSGEGLRTAQAMYNGTTAPEREALEEAFAELFSNFKVDINPSGDWSIKQYELLSDTGTVNE